MNAAVGLGVSVAVAVLTGALLVGDSMRGSLRDLALDRLGRVDFVLQNGHFFREALADELAHSDGFGDDFGEAVPAVLLRVNLTNPNGTESNSNQPVRANRVNLIGCDSPFWQLGRVEIEQIEKSGATGVSPVPHKKHGQNARGTQQVDREEELGSLLHGRKIILNRPLAEQLGADIGDPVLVRFSLGSTAPAESTLGRRDGPSSMRLQVAAIVEPVGLGAFGLNPSQRSPRNAYMDLETLQGRLDRPDQINTILIAARNEAVATSPEAERQLASILHPRLADYGLHVVRSPRGYLTLSTDRMLFSPSEESALEHALRETNANRTDQMLSSRSGELTLEHALKEIDANQTVQPALTYLANTIACGEHAIPYSTITAVDFATSAPLGPVLDRKGQPIEPLGPNDIVLNSWAADHLDAKPGDTIRVTYFEPESLHGRLDEVTKDFTLKAVIPLNEETADRDLLPEVPGVTDQSAMDNWDPPFPFDAKRIRPEDDAYWDRYRGTPKAYVSLAAGRRLWGSRFGQTTTLRVVEAGLARHKESSDQNKSDRNETGQTFEAQLGSQLVAEKMGFAVQPVKRLSLAASSGTTSFNMLFIGFSFFIIASAILLVVLLFRLGVELRSRQIGTLLAVGWLPRNVFRLLAVEGTIVALLGSVAGTALGVVYAWLMLFGLKTWWLAAIGTPFLQLHITLTSLLVGPLVGLGMSLVAILLSMRRVATQSPRQLMAGPSSISANSWKKTRGLSRLLSHGEVPAQNQKNRASAMLTPKHPRGKPPSQPTAMNPLLFVVIMLLVASGLAFLFSQLGNEFQAGVFFGVGALVLTGLLVAVGWWLSAGSRREAIRVGRGNVTRLAMFGAARHPMRSTLSVALVASACFLIVSVSAFRVEPASQPLSLNSANGHFSLIGQSDLPIHENLDTPQGRRGLGFSEQDSQLLEECKIISFRVRSGDDASCLNLYRPRQPRILGVPPAMIERGGFSWAASKDKANPWKALLSKNPENHPRGATGVSPVPHKKHGQDARGTQVSTNQTVPMVLERDTAVYSLHLQGGLGARFEVEDDDSRPVSLKVAGLLKGSPFQGDLLVTESELLRHWPEVNGYRFFLVDCPATSTADVQAALERTLGDYGFTAEPMEKYLAEYMAIPNTYLSTFQSLGGLGLLLGTFGLAVVQLRNVVERRRELAVLRAVGLRRQQIAWLVLAENGFLLLVGMACGIAAAIVAVLPHFVSGDASVPIASLTGTLALVLLVGLVASGLAVRAAVTSPLLDTLREE